MTALKPEVTALKGTGFSPYKNCREIKWALAPEGMHC